MATPASTRGPPAHVRVGHARTVGGDSAAAAGSGSATAGAAAVAAAGAAVLVSCRGASVGCCPCQTTAANQILPATVSLEPTVESRRSESWISWTRVGPVRLPSRGARPSCA